MDTLFGTWRPKEARWSKKDGAFEGPRLDAISEPPNVPKYHFLGQNNEIYNTST